MLYRSIVDKLWRHGWIADIKVDRGQIVSLELIPMMVDNRVVQFQPQVASPQVLPQLLALLNNEFDTHMEIVGERARLCLPIQEKTEENKILCANAMVG